ncbi:hypothetical protein [Thermoflexus sp.]|uniref:hypothetical protein n=1 Tax=Thermoflexus sp. TaxID=1969742 RepID=UPI0035E40682
MGSAGLLWELSRIWQEERLREAEQLRLLRECEARRQVIRRAWWDRLRQRLGFSLNRERGVRRSLPFPSERGAGLARLPTLPVAMSPGL